MTLAHLMSKIRNWTYVYLGDRFFEKELKYSEANVISEYFFH